MKCIVDYTGATINISNIDDYLKRSKSLKNHISRKKIDHTDVIKYHNINLNSCNFCGQI